MATLYALGAVCMLAATQVTSFFGMYVVILAFCLCYFPTVALTNSLAMQQVADPGRDFPAIRMMGTIGWIVINLVVGFMAIEATTTPFLLTAGACVVMALYSLLVLPHTPPRPEARSATVGQLIGLDAVSMLKDRSFAIFVVASVLACIPLTFYYSFTNPYLNELGMVNAAGKMTLGQFSEIGMMLLMPFVFRRISVRSILLLGLFTWTVRYVLLAYGDTGTGVWLLYLAILLHGVCYDFFFMTGQLYTDQVAPAHLRSTAQGFITFLTYGVGMLIGSLLSGGALDFFSTTTARRRDARLACVLDQLRGHGRGDRPARHGVLPVEGEDQGGLTGLTDDGLRLRATGYGLRAYGLRATVHGLAAPKREARRRAHTRSSTSAIPWPTPMHIVQSA